MKIAAGFICLLALPLAAQEEVYRELVLGDRVQLILRNDSTLRGTLVALPKDPRGVEKIESVDYVKIPGLTLDIKWEYPGSEGTITIPKDQIKVVRKLSRLDKATLARLEEDRKRIMKAVSNDEEERKASNVKRKEAAIKAAEEAAKEVAASAENAGKLDRLKAELADFEAGQDLLAQFPPPAWGPERFKKINENITFGVRPSSQEEEFIMNYDKWSAAWGQKEKEEEEAAKKEEEEKPPEE